MALEETVRRIAELGRQRDDEIVRRLADICSWLGGAREVIEAFRVTVGPLGQGCLRVGVAHLGEATEALKRLTAEIGSGGSSACGGEGREGGGQGEVGGTGGGTGGGK